MIVMGLYSFMNPNIWRVIDGCTAGFPAARLAESAGDRTFVYTVISSMGQKLSTVLSSMGKSEHCTFVYFDKQRTLLSSTSKLSTVFLSTRKLGNCNFVYYVGNQSTL